MSYAALPSVSKAMAKIKMVVILRMEQNCLALNGAHVAEALVYSVGIPIGSYYP